MDKYEATGAETVLTILAWAISIPLAGWVLSLGWRWFVVPIGVPPIGLWHAVGLFTLFRFRTGWKRTEDPTTNVEYYTRIGLWLLGPFLLWGVLWLYATLAGLR